MLTKEPERPPSEMPPPLSCLLLPLADGQLLVPVAILLEITTIQDPTPVADAPEWYLGELQWRKQRLPLFAFEAMRGREIPQRTSNCRIVMLNSGRLESGAQDIFALVVRGAPRMVEVTVEELVEKESRCLPGELMHVTLSGEAAVIPDLSALAAAKKLPLA